MKINKFQTASYQAFLSLPETKDYHIQETIFFHKEKLPHILQILQKYCYLIQNQNQKLFDIEETTYDTEDKKYHRLQLLNRPKQIKVNTQTIHLENPQTNFVLTYQNFHKTKLIQIPLPQTEIEPWKLNTLLQQTSVSLPYLTPQYTESFTRLYLYQPHQNTKIYLDIDLNLQTNYQDQIRLTLLSPRRKRHLLKILNQI